MRMLLLFPSIDSASLAINAILINAIVSADRLSSLLALVCAPLRSVQLSSGWGKNLKQMTVIKPCKKEEV